jgi:DNA-binding NtrC family response regulator
MKTHPKIFIVEDDFFYASLLENEILKNTLGEVEIYHSGEEFIANLHKSPDIVILDYNLGTMLGLEILKHIKDINLNTKVILLSSHGSMKTAISCLRYGAYDYIEKNEFAFSRIKNHIKIFSKEIITNTISQRQVIFNNYK